ncbi:MAG TPA: PspA/IM30 family protein [Gemmataceae bacterium]|nr:PspA/IM30 family protein [Gemmataceae bacterium]
MGFLEQVVLRLVLWVGLPLLLLVLVLGPGRVSGWLKNARKWLWAKRLDPEAILTEVVRLQQKRIDGLRKALARSEAAETDIMRNARKSEENIAGLDREAYNFAARGDDLGARAALYKLNMEQLAVKNFQEQLDRQRQHITESRRRLYLLELQLRQYEVGRSILLSQLAEAQTVEQQYDIANNFDPFSAIANWQQAEGMVQEKSQNARAAEQVYTDIAEIPLAGQPAQVDSEALDRQLEELKSRLGKAPLVTKAASAHAETKANGERNGT